MVIRRTLCAGVAAVGVLASNSAWAAPRRPDPLIAGTTNPCPAAPFRPLEAGDDVHYGSIKRSRCHIAYLNERGAVGHLSWNDVSLTTRELARLYEARAGRQQAWIDGSNSVTIFSTLGYIGSAGTNAKTLSFLGAGALVPVLLSQFNAHEPTRDLYHAGGLGFGLIAGRYEFMRHAERQLAQHRANERVQTVMDNARAACLALQGAAQDIDRRLKDGPEKTRLTTELVGLKTACFHYLSDLAALEAYEAALSVAVKNAPRLFAMDIVSLDTVVMQRDRQMRSTPLKSLTGLVASPLNSLNVLLTGQDGQAAIKTLQAQEALATLNMTLSPIDLPAAPKALSADKGVEMSAIMGIDLATTKLVAKPVDQEALRIAMATVQSAAISLNAARPLLAFRFRLVERVVEMEAANSLTFKSDAATRQVTVALGRPTPTPALTSK